MNIKITKFIIFITTLIYSVTLNASDKLNEIKSLLEGRYELVYWVEANKKFLYPEVAGVLVIQDNNALITLDKNMEGPDHIASLEPKEFKLMVESIRNIEYAMGDGIKKPTNAEQAIKINVRRSIVAKKHIKNGELLNEQNITTKRPEGGISPIYWDKIINSTAKRNYSPDEFIEW